MRDKFIYHVMIRGINRQDIFEAPEDYRKFIETLASLREVVSDDMQTKICTCHIYAYCIMPNHVHILIHEKDWTISQCVKYIADIYVRYYNKKYGRIGHLLQDRFKSEPCNDSDYFVVLMRYIHQNPVKAGLAKTAKEYCYSSWGNDYLGLADLQVCMTESVIRRYTLTELTAWVDMPMPERYGCIDIDERRVIPDIEIREAVIKACGLRSISEFQLLTLERRKTVIREVMLLLDVRPRQLARVTGMNYETIRNIAKKKHENRHPYPGACPHDYGDYGKVQGLSKDLIAYEGQTLDELRKDFEDGIDSYIEGCLAEGVEPAKPYSGKLNLRMSSELHSRVAAFVAATGTTINDFINCAIKNELKKAVAL